MSDSDLIDRQRRRERQARKAAEELLERKSLDLWNANEALRAAHNVLEQRVIGLQAQSAWRQLVRAHGTAAPGPAPAGMMVVPSVRAWQLIPSWEWHRAGVDPRQSRTVMVCLAVELCCGLG